MANLFGEVDSNETATKTDLKILHEDLKTGLSGIKTDLDWIKKYMFAIGMPVVIAALKYIVIG